MKYLADYTEKAISKALKDNGSFFAFGDDQFNKAKKEGIKYVSVGSGLIAPKDNAEKLLKEITEAHKNGIKKDIKENGKNNIIKRELNNHEAYYTGEIDQTVDALKDYNITDKDILTVFNEERGKEENYD